MYSFHARTYICFLTGLDYLVLRLLRYLHLVSLFGLFTWFVFIPGTTVHQVVFIEYPPKWVQCFLKLQ